MSLESVDEFASTLRFAGDLASPRWDPESPDTEVWLDNWGRECAYGRIFGGNPWMRVKGIGDFRIDPSGGATVVPDEGVPNSHVIDTYYRTVLPMALQLAGREVLHASAVVVPHGVLALCALSETGKSTLAYAMSRRGHELYADDAVVFEAAPNPILTQLPFALRLRPASAAHFGEVARDRVKVQGPQSGRCAEERRLAAICVLERIDGNRLKDGRGAADRTAQQAAEVERLSPAAAFAAVLPHAYCFSLRDSDRKKRMMQHYLALVNTIPVLRLSFLPGLAHIGEILEILEGALDEHTRNSRTPHREPRIREGLTPS